MLVEGLEIKALISKFSNYGELFLAVMKFSSRQNYLPKLIVMI